MIVIMIPEMHIRKRRNERKAIERTKNTGRKSQLKRVRSIGNLPIPLPNIAVTHLPVKRLILVIHQMKIAKLSESERVSRMLM